MSLLHTDSVYGIFDFSAFRNVAIFMVTFKHFMPNVYQYHTHTYFTRLAGVARCVRGVGGGGKEATSQAWVGG